MMSVKTVFAKILHIFKKTVSAKIVSLQIMIKLIKIKNVMIKKSMKMTACKKTYKLLFNNFINNFIITCY